MKVSSRKIIENALLCESGTLFADVQRIAVAEYTDGNSEHKTRLEHVIKVESARTALVKVYDSFVAIWIPVADEKRFRKINTLWYDEYPNALNFGMHLMHWLEKYTA